MLQPWPFFFLDLWPLWITLILCSALMAIVGKYGGRRLMHWVFKPVTMLLIMAPLGIYLLTHNGTALQMAVGVGLLLSLCGDIALMLDKRYFLSGMLFFLVAHVAYVIGFVGLLPELTGWQWQWLWVALLPYIIGFLVVSAMWKKLAKLAWPVLIYALVISSMVVVVMLYGILGNASLCARLLACGGALLFALSDVLLACRRFAGWRVIYAVELGSYFVAQLLLMLAALVPG